MLVLILDRRVILSGHSLVLACAAGPGRSGCRGLRKTIEVNISVPPRRLVYP